MKHTIDKLERLLEQAEQEIIILSREQSKLLDELIERQKAK